MTQSPTYLDPNAALQERVQDLLARLTLDEKISQMTSQAAAVPRLGIPAYNFWNEALHGVARNGRATVFPQAIGMAASWDPTLIEEVASAIADEGRAKYHAALKRNGETAQYQGLTFWSPNVNIFRDPRWGRGQETWGEDPVLTGEMGSAFVRGLQGITRAISKRQPAPSITPCILVLKNCAMSLTCRHPGAICTTLICRLSRNWWWKPGWKR
jgi:beta-glucosidase